MPEEKKICPFNEKLACEDCRIFKSIAGQNPECQVAAAARILFMLQMKGDAGGIPIYRQHG